MILFRKRITHLKMDRKRKDHVSTYLRQLHRELELVEVQLKEIKDKYEGIEGHHLEAEEEFFHHLYEENNLKDPI